MRQVPVYEAFREYPRSETWWRTQKTPAGFFDTTKKILRPLKPKWDDAHAELLFERTAVPLVNPHCFKLHVNISIDRNDRSSFNRSVGLLQSWTQHPKGPSGLQSSLHSMQTTVSFDRHTKPWPKTSTIDFFNYLFTPTLHTFPAAWRASFAPRRSAGLSLFQSLIIVQPAD